MTRSSSGFNAAALFQQAPGRRAGEAFADHMAARKLPPLDFWRKRLRDASRAVSGHAFDSASGREEALKHLQRMENHITARGGSSEFDPAYLAQCFQAVLTAMGSEDDGAEDDERTDDDRTAEERHRAATGEDDMGETEARSVVTTSGQRRDADHRNDFNSIKQRGADSALDGFDADALFQRGTR